MPTPPTKPLIILHGWSDTSTSFRALANWLEARGFNVTDIWLGDYLSLNDEITLPDLGFALRRALEKEGIAQTRHSFDLLVHSTGGLVAREYLRQICVDPATGRRDATRSPIEHLCMLAPANFGSPLAKLGKSVLGRIFKGWDWDHFAESGRRVLQALDLASPYSFQLALDDLFDPGFPIFAPENVLTTVMVGTAPYAGALRSSLHEDGSDGTVRVATANLEASYFHLDFTTRDGLPELVAHPRTAPEIALAVLHRNHGTITQPPAPKLTDKHEPQPDPDDDWARTLTDALSLRPAAYLQHVARCQAITDHTMCEGQAGPHPEWYHHYQHVVARVRDQHGVPVEDYMLEFYQEPRDDEDRVFKKINTDILEKVTRNDQAPSHRSFFFDVTALRRYLDSRPGTVVEMSISAAHVSRRILFRNPTRGVPVFMHGSTTFIRPSEPILVDITLHRDPVVDSTDKAIAVFRLGK